jgi:hypothetical protein
VKLRTIGFGLTTAAVLVLLGSLILGLRGEPEGQELGRLAAEGEGVAESTPVKVEVLNGAEIPGLAREVTEQLREDGFDVVFYGNAGSLARDSTTVLDRSGDTEAVAAVAEAIGVNRIEVALDTTLYLAATVVLGRDWPGLAASRSQ